MLKFNAMLPPLIMSAVEALLNRAPNSEFN